MLKCAVTKKTRPYKACEFTVKIYVNSLFIYIMREFTLNICVNSRLVYELIHA